MLIHILASKKEGKRFFWDTRVSHHFFWESWLNEWINTVETTTTKNLAEEWVDANNARSCEMVMCSNWQSECHICVCWNQTSVIHHDVCSDFCGQKLYISKKCNIFQLRKSGSWCHRLSNKNVFTLNSTHTHICGMRLQSNWRESRIWMCISIWICKLLDFVSRWRIVMYLNLAQNVDMDLVETVNTQMLELSFNHSISMAGCPYIANKLQTEI